MLYIHLEFKKTKLTYILISNESFIKRNRSVGKLSVWKIFAS